MFLTPRAPAGTRHYGFKSGPWTADLLLVKQYLYLKPFARHLSRHLSHFGVGLALGSSLLTPSLAWAVPAEDADNPEVALRKVLVQRCQKRWTNNFVPMAESQFPPSDPLNDDARVVVLDVAADRKGKLLSAQIAASSGASALDEAAKEIALDSGPFPKVDETLLSDDGNLHVAWVFARKDGRCDDLQLKNVHLAPELAIPTLLSQGRPHRAWQRLTEALADGNDKALGVYARHWLKHASKDKKLGLTATAALAEGGDRDSAAHIGALAEAGKLPVPLWQALARSGQSVCPLASKALQDSNAAARLAALKALEIRFDNACVVPVVTIALNGAAPVDERVAALKALATSDADEARAGAKKVLNDANVQVRAAAMRSWAQSDTGRKALFLLTPLLKDSQVAIRAAATAGVARSSGDKGLEQLYLVFKEKDPVIYEALSEELGLMSTEASAEMLRKFTRKDDVRIRRAAAAALASRSDRFARAAVAPLITDADPSMRWFAAHAVSPADRRTLADEIASNQKAALSSFGTLLNGDVRSVAALLLLTVLPEANDATRIEWLKTWLRLGEAGGGISVARTP